MATIPARQRASVWPLLAHRLARCIIRTGRGCPGVWRLRQRVLDFERIRFPETIVKANLFNGATLWVRPNDPIGRAIYYDGKWEAEVIEHFQSQLRPGDCVLDIGANIGEFAVVAGMAVGTEGRVVAVEAGQAAFGLLQRNVTENRLTNVQTLHLAAWDEETVLHLAGVREDMLGWGKVQEQSSNQTEAVPAAPLDAVLPELGCAQIDVMKVDVEGAEFRALQGLRKIIEDHPPRAIYCEVANNHDCYGSTAQELVDFFTARGYGGSLLEQKGLVPFDPSLLRRTLNVTVVFLRKERERV
jgi:FkbM family methyltransferase